MADLGVLTHYRPQDMSDPKADISARQFLVHLWLVWRPSLFVSLFATIGKPESAPTYVNCCCSCTASHISISALRSFSFVDPHAFTSGVLAHAISLRVKHASSAHQCWACGSRPRLRTMA